MEGGDTRTRVISPLQDPRRGDVKRGRREEGQQGEGRENYGRKKGLIEKVHQSCDGSQ
jgi:hypothetical protein